jgi:hypothetical protein
MSETNFGDVDGQPGSVQRGHSHIENCGGGNARVGDADEIERDPG